MKKKITLLALGACLAGIGMAVLGVVDGTARDPIKLLRLVGFLAPFGAASAWATLAMVRRMSNRLPKPALVLIGVALPTVAIGLFLLDEVVRKPHILTDYLLCVLLAAAHGIVVSWLAVRLVLKRSPGDRVGDIFH